MRWAVFAAAALVAVVLDASFLDGLAPDAAHRIRPSLSPVLAVFLALSAPRATALWACFIIGLLLDLASPVLALDRRLLYLAGPMTLGYLAGAWAVLKARPLVFRQRALTIGAMTVLLLVVANTVAVVLYVVRGWLPGGPVGWADGTVARAIAERLLSALYSGIVAVPVGWLLVRSAPLWGFHCPGPRG